MSECRILVFGVLDASDLSITDIIGSNYTDHLLALSDDCIKSVEAKCRITGNLSRDQEEKLFYDSREVTDTSKGKALYDMLCKNTKDQMDVWYKGGNREVKESVLRDAEEKDAGVELWLGINELFSKLGHVEILLANKDPFSFDEKDVRLLSLYLETVNNKKDSTYKVDYALIPGLIVKSGTQTRKGYFQGNEESGSSKWKDPEKIKLLTAILAQHGIRSFCQYETNQEASYPILAENGYEPFAKAAVYLEREKHADMISCCYPNLRSKYDGYYIGAAFVAIICMETGVNEDEETEFPREPESAKPQIRSEIRESRRDFCFYAVNKPNMVLLSKRNCSREHI